MSTVFDIEQSILRMWATEEDLMDLASHLERNQDTSIAYVIEALHCLATVHNLRGDNAFNTLEQLIKEQHAKETRAIF